MTFIRVACLNFVFITTVTVFDIAMAGGDAATSSKPRSVSNFRRLLELLYMLVATLAALLFFQKAREIEDEKSGLERELRLTKDAAMAKSGH